MIALTRCLAEGCCDATLLSKNTASDIPASHIGHSYSQCWDNCIHDVLLLLGRFSWLLKINGSFLVASLSCNISVSSSKLIDTNSSTSFLDGDVDMKHDNVTYYTSYDQLQSAFDIADSDGDGLITYSEALEVYFYGYIFQYI